MTLFSAMTEPLDQFTHLLFQSGAGETATQQTFLAAA